MFGNPFFQDDNRQCCKALLSKKHIADAENINVVGATH